ncbi:MAG: hypothetical protein M3134_00900 [Actinomycetota bacterium]|nr:hypothetical protein [Actinomycetota bacterium]
MASARVLRLAGATALVAAALPISASAPAAASWPGGNGDVFAVQYAGETTSIVRLRNGQVAGTVGGNLTEFSNFATDLSGERLVYSRAGEIVLVDLQTMDETVLTESEAIETDPVFSYDGRYVIYVGNGDGDQEIYMWDLVDPGNGPFKLTNNSVDDWAPAWGNDGTGHGDLIAYVSLQNSAGNGESDIWTMTPDGSNKTDLTNNSVADFGPNWRPSFDMLAYSSRDELDRDQIHTMSWDGTGKDQLTIDDNYNYEPAWSPDGTRIAFTKQGTAAGSPGRIFVMPADPGSSATPLSPPSATVGFDRADWQATPNACEPNCEPPDELQPVVFMSLKKHVVVSGRVEGTAGVQGGVCGVNNPMQIQRYSKGQFRPVANVTTNQDGTFSKKVPDRTGRYRVVSFEFTDEANETNCLAATSPVKVHRHPR